MKDLIDRLRACPERGRNTIEAAGALDAQAKYIRQLEDAVTPELVMLRARVADYETRLTAVMPADFKDWHENSKAEWPEIAAWVITNLRAQLAEIAKTKPVGAIYTIAGVQHCTITETLEDTDLFTSPMPAQGVNAGPMGCAWTQDPDFELGDTYHSACGEVWSFIDGGPAENRVRYCQGCGKPVAQEATIGSKDDEGCRQSAPVGAMDCPVIGLEQQERNDG